MKAIVIYFAIGILSVVIASQNTLLFAGGWEGRAALSLEESLAKVRKGEAVDSLDFGGTFGASCPSPEQYHYFLEFPDLKGFSIYACRIDKVPKEIFQLKSLEYLSLISNNLTEIPKEIGNLVNLEILDLRQNQFTEVPESIGRLMNLEKLDLSGNQIEYLPSIVTNLVNLKRLEMWSYGAKNNIQLSFDGKETSYKDNWELPYAKKQIVNAFKNPDTLIIPEAYTVTATSGLSVREKPNLKAKKIGTMPHKLRIAVYEESKNTETIDGITAPWMRIKAVANGKYMEGWTWGGYLEKFVYTE